jgi:hypothetical protein
MATSCIIDDYVNRKRSSLLFMEQNFTGVLASWNTADPILADLQSIDLFAGRTTWAHLDPSHFRILITNTLNNRDKTLQPSEHFSESQPLVANLYFLIMGLIFSIQGRTGAAVDSIRLMRLSELEVTVGFDLTMMMETKKKAEPPKHGLQVIVDNT